MPLSWTVMQIFGVQMSDMPPLWKDHLIPKGVATHRLRACVCLFARLSVCSLGWVCYFVLLREFFLWVVFMCQGDFPASVHLTYLTLAAKRGQQIPWKWSYRWLQAKLWVLAIKAWSPGRAEPSLQLSPHLLFFLFVVFSQVTQILVHTLLSATLYIIKCLALKKWFDFIVCCWTVTVFLAFGSHWFFRYCSNSKLELGVMPVAPKIIQSEENNTTNLHPSPSCFQHLLKLCVCVSVCVWLRVCVHMHTHVSASTLRVQKWR